MKNANRTSVGELIKIARIKAGLSQMELARRMGYNEASRISSIEQSRNPHGKTVARIAAVLGIDIDALLFPGVDALRANDYQREAMRTAGNMAHAESMLLQRIITCPAKSCVKNWACARRAFSGSS